MPQILSRLLLLLYPLLVQRLPFLLMLFIPTLLGAAEVGGQGVGPTPPSDVITWKTLGTLAGASGITVLICNVMQATFNFNPRWLALLVSEILCIAVVYYTKSQESGAYFLGVLNGFLVCSSAVGVAQVIGQGAGGPGAGGGPIPRRRFFDPWF
jgi:hypothetical protein